MTPVAIYIHIPYCVRKCLYCDFLSFAVGREQCANYQQFEDYVNHVIREIDTYSTEDICVKSVFFGGGTPTVIPGELIAKILCKLKKCFPFQENAEITIEANPGTVTEDKLKVYLDAGINRISFGLQSADNEELRNLGRIHSYEDFVHSYELARAAGFDNISVDLMSAIPGQTLTSYRKTLERVLELKPQHISAYSLIVEEGTPFYEMYGEGAERKDVMPLPDEDTERTMYELTREVLREHGYEQYEISNYAKCGYVSLHNITYWTREPYIGLGLGASSFYGGRRYKNETATELYVEHFTDPATVEIPDAEDAMEETMFLGLRMNAGVDEKRFETTFGKKIDEVYPGVTDRLMADGLIRRVEGRICLTEKGMDLGNYVSVEYILKTTN